MVPEADQFPKKTASPSHPSLSRADPSAGLALQGFIRGFLPRPCSHLRSLKERDPKSARLSTTTARKLPEETNPSPASPSWASNTWWGELARTSLAAVFVAEPRFSPAWPRKARAPPVPLHSAGARLPAAPPPQLPCSTLPPSQGALGLAKQKGRGKKGGEEAGGSRASPFLKH